MSGVLREKVGDINSKNVTSEFQDGTSFFYSEEPTARGTEKEVFDFSVSRLQDELFKKQQLHYRAFSIGCKVF